MGEVWSVPMGGLWGAVLRKTGRAKMSEMEAPSMGASTLARFQMTSRLAMSEKKPPTSQKAMIMNTG
jgi:hypothetical protein